MPDVFTQRKRSEVMARIRARGNRDTELALAKLLRSHGITGWRRQQVIRIGNRKRHARRSRPTSIRPDFVFSKQRVAVFVDGCFWHGCPKHSPPAKWLKKSAMPEWAAARSQKSGDRRNSKPRQRSFAALRMTTIGSMTTEGPTTTEGQMTAEGRLRTEGPMTTKGERTGKAFWRSKLAANMARDRQVNRQLRRRGWRVLRLWEHELAINPGRCIERIKRALKPSLWDLTPTPV
jgi:DNA mismatch endonuclease (patch repair protein)